MSFAFSATNASKADFALPSAPSDGVSDITFSPTGNLITAGSWDNGVLACLQILSRGNVFADIYHMSFISFQTVAATFHRFCKYFAEELYDEYIYLPTGEDLRRVMEQYDRIGFPGAVGSTDVTHIYWCMCPYNQARMYTGKEGKPTVAFQVTVDHSGRVLAVTRGFTGATNDKTIIRYDTAVTCIRTDPVYTEQKYKLYAQDGEQFEERGCYLLVDNGYHKVRVWELQRGYGTQSITAVPKAQINHDAPVLCTDFSADGTKVFSGGASKQVNMWSLGQPGTTGQQIGVHDAAVKTVRFIPEMNLVASASWDRTVKFWDTRTSTPAAVLNLCERAYSMDTRGAMMVVATADRKICVYNLGSWTTNGPAPQTMTDSPLRYQTRCVSIFPDQQGFAVGSIEGRVGIEYFSEQAAKQQAASGYKPATTYGSTKLSFAFKCHRVAGTQSSVYSVNSIAFHKYGTFATAGSDGNFHFWDKDSRQRLKAYDLKQGNTISVCKFSPDGGLFGYAMSYDWSQGVEHANPQATNNIFVHAVADDEIKPRPKDKK